MKRRVLVVQCFLVWIAACGEGRPDGTAQVGTVEITASASVNAVSLPPDGVTAGESIVVEGTILDKFGVVDSVFSWNDAEYVDLELDTEGRFQLNLRLSEDRNELKVRAASVAEEEKPALLALSYFRDVKAPTIEVPNISFAAEITIESDMLAEKTATAIVLSGGESVPVRDGVAFSKYSSRYGVDQPNRPVWRFKLDDNYSDNTDSVFEFRVLRENNDVLVHWSDASPSSEADFEVTVSSELNARIGEESGEFWIEVRATDGAGNVSEVIRQKWTQAILSPQIYIAAGGEEIMGLPEDPRNPSNFILGQNFSDITKTEGLIVGSLRVGNPNDVPVLVRLTSDADSRSSYTWERTWTALELDVEANISANFCRSKGLFRKVENDDCYDDIGWNGLPKVMKRQSDESNETLGFEIRTVGGTTVSTGQDFIIPANTEYYAMAILLKPLSNVLSGLDDYAVFGPYPAWNNITAAEKGQFINCIGSGTIAIPCERWDRGGDIQHLLKFFATWDFTARVQSKVNLDITDGTRWNPAESSEVVGYSRVMADAANGRPIPTSHDDF